MGGFFYLWLGSAGSDLAGTTKPKYPSNVVPMTACCSNRVDPQHLLQAFSDGADGVLTGGCEPGDCHSDTGNCKTLKRVQLVRRLLHQLGIEAERLRLEWISAAEGGKVAQVVRDFVREVRGLGPFNVTRFVPAGRAGVVKEMK